MRADQFITKSIHDNFPHDRLLSEELQPNFTGPGQDRGSATWIIDPLDGTTNFSLGFYIWGVLITRLVDGWPDCTVMYFPKIHECYSAKYGQGAYLNENQIRVESPSKERPLSFFSCCSRTFRRYNVNVPYKARILGSAAYTFSALAHGIAVLGFEAMPKIWDIAGAWLLVQEAGGVIEPFDGNQPFPLKDDIEYRQQSYPTIGAATQEVLNRARQQITPK
jgi:myo-inositol-1(or 4)-monophosphatase